MDENKVRICKRRKREEQEKSVVPMRVVISQKYRKGHIWVRIAYIYRERTPEYVLNCKGRFPLNGQTVVLGKHDSKQWSDVSNIDTASFACNLYPRTSAALVAVGQVHCRFKPRQTRGCMHMSTSPGCARTLINRWIGTKCCR
jgi:hypothetical protein